MALVGDSQNVGSSSEVVVSKNEVKESKGSDSKPELEMQELGGSLSKLTLNPLAKEFYPSGYRRGQTVVGRFNRRMRNNGFRRRTNYTQWRRMHNGRGYRAEREDSTKRTVYVSEVDHDVSEVELASVFIETCGPVVDCRICGDPVSLLRFAFVEFTDERGAKEALKLSGTVVGLYAIKVLPSRTAILPVNPLFLPKSEDELEMVARTIYCTNIDYMISVDDIGLFFESYCGEVTRLRLLGDRMRSPRTAFVEFAAVDSAFTALSLSGFLLRNRPIRVSPSKTPLRDPIPQRAQE